MEKQLGETVLDESIDDFILSIFATEKTQDKESPFFEMTVPTEVPESAREKVRPVVETALEKIFEGFGNLLSLKEAIADDRESMLVLLGSILELDNLSDVPRLQETMREYDIQLDLDSTKLDDAMVSDLYEAFEDAVFELPWDWKISESRNIIESSVGEAAIYDDLVNFFEKNVDKPASVAQTFFFAVKDAFGDAPRRSVDEWMTRFLKFLAKRF